MASRTIQAAPAETHIPSVEEMFPTPQLRGPGRPNAAQKRADAEAKELRRLTFAAFLDEYNKTVKKLIEEQASSKRKNKRITDLESAGTYNSKVTVLAMKLCGELSFMMPDSQIESEVTPDSGGLLMFTLKNEHGEFGLVADKDGGVPRLIISPITYAYHRTQVTEISWDGLTPTAALIIIATIGLQPRCQLPRSVASTLRHKTRAETGDGCWAEVQFAKAALHHCGQLGCPYCNDKLFGIDI